MCCLLSFESPRLSRLLSLLNRSPARRDCDPTTFTDPADLRTEPIEAELELEYLIYGLFERSDRPDGAFLSKRWVRLDDLLEHVGLGVMESKIKEWAGSRAARQQAAIDAVFQAAEQRQAEGGQESDGGSDSGSDSGSGSANGSDSDGSDEEEGGEDGAPTLAQMCERSNKRLRAAGAEVQEVAA